MSTCSLCVLCFHDIIKNNDKTLVDGSGSFKVRKELNTVNFNIQSNSPYVCKSCVGKLKKRHGIINNLQKIEADISALHQSSKKRKISKVRLPSNISGHHCAYLAFLIYWPGEKAHG